MNVIRVPNVNVALHEGLWLLKTGGLLEESRNGPVLVAPGPVATVYEHPMQRVLFHPKRDANPVFHLIEAIWMLAGRRDVEKLLPFNSRYDSYAEEDGNVHGAYGHRWRKHFAFDQLQPIIEELKNNPTSRRVVLTMWDPLSDLDVSKRDVPCNTHIYFRVSEGRLDMTVCCRSNDAVWGAYGANVVHFSMLQELIAHAAGLGLGTYTQFSNNFHLYVNTHGDLMKEMESDPTHDYYEGGGAKATPILGPDEHWTQFIADCEDMMEVPLGTAVNYRTRFFQYIAGPLHWNYLFRKGLVHGGAAYISPECERQDWVVAFDEWLARRASKENTNV